MAPRKQLDDKARTRSQKAAADVTALLRARNPLLWVVTREEHPGLLQPGLRGLLVDVMTRFVKTCPCGRFQMVAGAIACSVCYNEAAGRRGRLTSAAVRPGDAVYHRSGAEDHRCGVVLSVEGSRAMVRWPRWPETPSEELICNLEVRLEDGRPRPGVRPGRSVRLTPSFSSSDRFTYR